MFKGFDNTVFCNDDIVFVNADSDNVTIFTDHISLDNIDLNNVNIITLMMIILTMMILKLLFILDLWLGIIDISKKGHVKRKLSSECLLHDIQPNGWIGACQKMNTTI